MIKHKQLMITAGVLLSAATISFAQQNTDAAGGNATGAGGSVSYSVGQIDYTYSSGSNGNINEGVQQPYEIYISGVEDGYAEWGLSVYPNPSTNILFLKIEKENFEDVSFQLLDINSKIILTKKIQENITEISMENYASSTYFLTILNNTQEVKTFKIIKK